MNNKQTILVDTIQHDRVERLSELLRRDPQIATRVASHDRSTLLLFAASVGAEKCVKLLLPLSNPLWVNRKGYSALIVAVKTGSVECVNLLLPHSNVEQADAQGLTALMHAAIDGKVEKVKTLIPVGTLSPITQNGWNAAEFAFERALRCDDPNSWVCADLLCKELPSERAKWIVLRLNDTLLSSGVLPETRARLECEELRQELTGSREPFEESHKGKTTLRL